MCCTIEDVGRKTCLCAYADHEWQDITTLLCYSQAAELSLAADAFAYAGLLWSLHRLAPAWPLGSINALHLKCHHACMRILASCRHYPVTQQIGSIGWQVQFSEIVLPYYCLRASLTCWGILNGMPKDMLCDMLASVNRAPLALH